MSFVLFGEFFLFSVRSCPLITIVTLVTYSCVSSQIVAVLVQLDLLAAVERRCPLSFFHRGEFFIFVDISLFALVH